MALIGTITQHWGSGPGNTLHLLKKTDEFIIKEAMKPYKMKDWCFSKRI